MPPTSSLSSSARRALRAAAHHLEPVVMIGQHGLTPAVLHEIDLALTAHALIKVRVQSDERETREAFLAEICQKMACESVQHLGKLLVLWRNAGDGGDDDVVAGQEAVSVKAASGRGPRSKLPRPASSAVAARGQRTPVPRGAVTASRCRHRRGARAGRRKIGGAPPASVPKMAPIPAAVDMVAAGTPARVSMLQEDEPRLAAGVAHHATNSVHRHAVVLAALAERATAAAAPEKQPATVGVSGAISMIAAAIVAGRVPAPRAVALRAIPAPAVGRRHHGRAATVGATATAFPANHEALRRAAGLVVVVRRARRRPPRPTDG